MKIVKFLITEYAVKEKDSFEKETKNIIQVMEMQLNNKYESILVSDKKGNEGVVFYQLNPVEKMVHLFHKIKGDHKEFLKEELYKELVKNKLFINS